MPLITYKEKKFTAASEATIGYAAAIINKYAAAGYDMTLRQVYYKLVTRNLIENTKQSYKRIVSLLGDARLAGLIDWDNLVDRTRSLRERSHWNTPGEIIRGVANGFGMDLWEGQKYRPEVWIEKDALIGIIERVCTRLDVAYFSCRGYTSLSEMWQASQRLIEYNDAGQTPVIIHLGDHDPSGIDMSRDIEDRLRTFEADLKFERIALNMDQIDQYNPPPNPAKIKDSRAPAYIAKHGYESWELDALEPSELEKLIEQAVQSYRNDRKWKARKKLETKGKTGLRVAADRWSEVEVFLDG